MKLNSEFKDVEVEVFGNVKPSMEAEIDTSDMSFVFDLVSNQLYSNPIGSVVREITSNCFDAHQAAGKTAPVIIKFQSIEYQNYISFIDFGTGLSPEAMDTVYRKYFKSTKRDSNEFIGAFGLGSKSPLSYTDLFYIITRVDGIEYKYSFDKRNGKPSLDPLGEKKTEEENGTEIRVPLVQSSDRYRFIEEIEKQLAYFDDVFVAGIGTDYNESKILDKETFKFKTNNLYSGNMHICLGKVSYPIDWDFLGIKVIPIALAVKFEIGELSVVPNRESIRYDEVSKELIKSRINLTIEELKGYSNDIKVFEDLIALKEFKSSDRLGGKSFTLDLNSFIININSVREYSTKDSKYHDICVIDKPKITIKGFEHLDIDFRSFDFKTYLDNFYRIDKLIHNETYSLRSTEIINVYDSLVKKVAIYRIKADNFQKVKNFSIIKEEKNSVLILRKIGKIRLGKDIIEIISSNTSKISKKKFTSLETYNRNKSDVSLFKTNLHITYKELNKAVLKYIVKNTKSYEDFEVSKDSKELYKRLTSRRVSSNMPVKDYTFQWGKFISTVYDFDISAVKKGTLLIYGSSEHKELLKFACQSINDIYSKNHKFIKILETTKKHYKTLKDLSNTYFIEDFLKSDNTVYKKLVTNILIKKLLKERKFERGLKVELLAFVSESKRKEYQISSEKLGSYQPAINEDLEEMVLLYAKENRLIDYERLKEVEEIIKFEYNFLLLGLIINVEELEKDKYSKEVRKYLKANRVKTPIIDLSKRENNLINLTNSNKKVYGFSKISRN